MDPEKNLHGNKSGAVEEKLSEDIFKKSTNTLNDTNDTAENNVLPSLRSFDPGENATFDPKIFRGPTHAANWVIPKWLMASGYPGNRQEDEHEKVVRDLCNSGVMVIVNLMTEQELLSFRKNRDLILKYQPKMRLISFPIPDQSTVEDELIEKLVQELANILLKEKLPIVVHCHGGHGRTGTIVAILISRIYQIDSKAALRIVQGAHKTRIHQPNNSSPQAPRQFEQVRRLSWKPQ